MNPVSCARPAIVDAIAGMAALRPLEMADSDSPVLRANAVTSAGAANSRKLSSMVAIKSSSCRASGSRGAGRRRTHITSHSRVRKLYSLISVLWRPDRRGQLEKLSTSCDQIILCGEGARVRLAGVDAIAEKAGKARQPRDEFP